MHRRDAIQLGAAAAAATFIGGISRADTRPLRVLILGGTGFIGPHMIASLRKSGHAITLFNNDKKSAELFPDLESLFGDRDGRIDALKGREWDVVVDNSGYVPRIVRLTAEALKDRVRHYVFISTQSVYADRSTRGIDESSPLATLQDPTVEQVSGDTYGGLKVLCEQVVEQTYGRRSTILRPTYIVGPGDSTDRFTYWLVRATRGGEMLAPGQPGDVVQFIDVRDLADFTRTAVEQRFTGAYNLCTPPGRHTIGELIDASIKQSKADTRVVWVDEQFLVEQKLPMTPELPIWSPRSGRTAGMGYASNERAVAQGLKYQPLEATVRDTLAWHAARPVEERQKLKAGLTPERERELLSKYRETKKNAA